MRFLANENYPLASIRLRSDGHDAASVTEDSPGAKDVEVLGRATREGRIVLTFDRDYGGLIFRHGIAAPFGVVFYRYDPATPQEPAAHLLRLLSTSGLVIEGKFTVAERGRVRQRALP